MNMKNRAHMKSHMHGRQFPTPTFRQSSESLRSDYLTQGPSVVGFEEAICSFCDAKYGVATNSATSALHIACKALDLGPKDLFWTSPISFVASANCALYCGAEVDFVDIDPIHIICVLMLWKKS